MISYVFSNTKNIEVKLVNSADILIQIYEKILSSKQICRNSGKQTKDNNKNKKFLLRSKWGPRIILFMSAFFTE